MDRRNFLKTSSKLVAAGALLPSAVKAVFSKSGTEESFSLEVITDNADKASAMLEALAKNGNLGTTDLKFTEYPIAGDVVGDIVFVKNGRLFDFTNSSDAISLGLKEVRKSLNLPALISNPVRVRLYRKTYQDMSKVFVMRKGEIIKQVDFNSYGAFSLNGKSGLTKIDVSVSGIRVLDSECRHKICRQMKTISKSGDFITCIPNEIHIFAE